VSAKKEDSFAPLRADVAEILGQINYATMTTVDRRGRPRSRVLIAVWELDGERPLGWLATFRTPVKAAHIAHNPHVGMSYWSSRQEPDRRVEVLLSDERRVRRIGTDERAVRRYRAG
jgi:general stress protein 26